MGKTVVLIGLGQLGRRYLEGLLKSSSEMGVWAVDSNSDALKQAQGLASQAKSHTSVALLRSISEVPTHADLMISATTADVRVSTFKELLEGRTVHHVILEKVLTQSRFESEELTRLAAQVQQVWVNYPRRVMTWHQCLRESIGGKAPVRASKDGASWGLVTNGLHFIDLFEWWTGSHAQEISAREQSFEWRESKRSGFLDATGIIDVTFGDGSVLTLQSNPEEGQPDKGHIQVISGGESLSISEVDGVAHGSMLARPITGRLEYQSALTSPLVMQILQEGACGLPTLKDVLATHDLFLSALLFEQDKRFGTMERLMVT